MDIKWHSKAIIFRLMDDGRHGELTDKFCVTIGKRLICAPKGFITDFASVPRLFWRLIPPWGKYSRASVIHDYLYKTGNLVEAIAGEEVTTGKKPDARKDADLVFLALMRNLGVSSWQSYLIYRAVRIGGGRAWKRYRKKENLAAK